MIRTLKESLKEHDSNFREDSPKTLFVVMCSCCQMTMWSVSDNALVAEDNHIYCPGCCPDSDEDSLEKKIAAPAETVKHAIRAFMEEMVYEWQGGNRTILMSVVPGSVLKRLREIQDELRRVA